MLPFKVFHSLEELAEYNWLGVTSADEIIHMASMGMVPVYLTIEFGKYCYYSTYQRFLKEYLDLSDSFFKSGDSEKKDGMDKIKDCISSFTKDYNQPMAQVPPYCLLEMLFDRKTEITTSHLLGPPLNAIFTSLLEISDYNDMAIVVFDPEEHCLPDQTSIKLVDLIIPGLIAEELSDNPPESITVDYKPEKYKNDVAPPLPNALTESILPISQDAIILETWKEIANYVGCSVATVQRHYGDMVGRAKTGKVITTTVAIDEYRLKSATKKKRKK